MGIKRLNLSWPSSYHMNIWDQKAPNISGISWFIHVDHQFLYQLAMWSFFAPGSRPELKKATSQAAITQPSYWSPSDDQTQDHWRVTFQPAPKLPLLVDLLLSSLGSTAPPGAGSTATRSWEINWCQLKKQLRNCCVSNEILGSFRVGIFIQVKNLSTSQGT